MKKKFMLLGIIGLVPFMTACGGGNKLTCTYDNGSGFVSTMVINFDKEDKVESAYLEESVTLEYANCESFEDCEAIEKQGVESCESSTKYENCKSKHSGQSIIISADVKGDALTSGVSGFSTGDTKQDVKNMMLDNSYKCE